MSVNAVGLRDAVFDCHIQIPEYLGLSRSGFQDGDSRIWKTRDQLGTQRLVQGLDAFASATAELGKSSRAIIC